MAISFPPNPNVGDTVIQGGTGVGVGRREVAALEAAAA